MSDEELNEVEQEALAEAEAELDVQDDSSEPESILPSETEAPSESEGGEGGMEAADAKPAWQSQLEEAGFQTFDDVDNAVRALVDSNRQRDEQIKTYADQLKWYQNQLTNHEPAKPQPVEKPAEELDPLSELVTDWQDPSWANQYIEVDEEGNRVIADHVDDATREKIMGIDRKLRQWQDVLQDPRQFAAAVDKRVERMIRDNFESSYTQKQTEAMERSEVDNFVNQNANWLYQRDPATGQFLTDPVTGDFIYSEQGNQFLGHMDQFARDGIQSVPSQIRYASMVMGVGSQQASPAPQPATPQPTVQQTADQQRSAMRGRKNTSRTPQKSFNGVTAESGADPAGKAQMSFGEETLAALMTGQE